MSLEFILFIDDTKATDDWRHHLASRMRLRCLREDHGNFCEIEENRDYESSRTDDPEEGFLYFRWRLNCSPGQKRTKLEQMELARCLRAIIEETGCRVVVGANFEDEL
ncbi:MAG: hypothetical protein ACO1SX_02650 [Actinomycetota bacterium]